VGSTEKGGVFQIEWNGGGPRVQCPDDHGESIFAEKCIGLDVDYHNGLGETIRPKGIPLGSQGFRPVPDLSHVTA